MTLALAQAPHLRATVGAPLTLADVPLIAVQVLAMLAGREPPALPRPRPGTGQPETRPRSLWAELREQEDTDHGR